MKNNKLRKKLNINKTTVANLNHVEMKRLRAGDYSVVETYCEPCMITNPSEENSSCPGCLVPCIPTVPKDPILP